MWMLGFLGSMSYTVQLTNPRSAPLMKQGRLVQGGLMTIRYRNKGKTVISLYVFHRFRVSENKGNPKLVFDDGMVQSIGGGAQTAHLKGLKKVQHPGP